MRTIGFTSSQGFTTVFVDNEGVGVIRQTSSGPAFVPGKRRGHLDADTLRAIAVKLEMMEKSHERV